MIDHFYWYEKAFYKKIILFQLEESSKQISKAELFISVLSRAPTEFYS